MCEWSENYPDENTIAFDLNNGDLFVMKNDKKEIVATISMDHNDAVRIFLCGDKTSRIKRIIAIAGGAPGMIVAFALCDRTASETNMMLRVFTVCVCVIELAVFMTWKLRSAGKWSFVFWDVFVRYRWTLWFALAMSVITFVMFGIDKYRAVKGGYRIPIAVLLGMAFAGGSIGALLGMLVFRHKIRKNYFSVGVPIILMMQVVLLMCAVNLL